jgi:hypothetical protein
VSIAGMLDRSAFRIGPVNLVAAGVSVAYAAALTTLGTAGVLAALLLTVDVVVLLLPWRVPRSERGSAGIAIESVACMAVPLLIAASTAGGPVWRSTGWPWLIAGLVTGVLLVGIGGPDPRMLLRGELAFLLGPRRAGHAATRMVVAGVSPFGEEATYRGVILLAPSAAALPIGLLGALAFVARHHVPLDYSWRGSLRHLGVELASAASMLALTTLSHSIYPALIAHMVNNSTAILLEWQRMRDSAESET